MAVTLNILLILFVILSLYKWEKWGSLKLLFFPAVVIKILSGIALGLVYKYYYNSQGDTFQYFDDAKKLSVIFNNNPHLYFKIIFNGIYDANTLSNLNFAYQPRAMTMVKILSPIVLLSAGNYWISAVYLSIFSFAGCWVLANRLSIIFPEKKHAAALAFLFFPSIVFWGSGIIKESILLGLICLSVAIVLKNDFKNWQGFVQLLFLLFVFYILWQLKYYYLAVLLPILAAYFISGTLFTYLSLKKRVLIFAGIFIFILIISTWLHPNLSADNFALAIIKNHDITVRSNPSSLYIHFYQLSPHLNNILINIPLAFFSGLYRNFIWEGRSIFQFLTGLENFFILLLSLYNIVLIVKRKLTISQPLMLLTTGIYIFLLSTLLALSSPNFGSLSRYKVGYLPFFIFLIVPERKKLYFKNL